MTKFIDCLIQMPNLRTLEVFSASHISPITKGLKRKSARFPSIRALAISDRTAKFVGNCPNVETVTAPDRLGSDGAAILSSYGGVLKNLKRIVGVAEYCVPLGEFNDMLQFLFTEGTSKKWYKASRTSKRSASRIRLELSIQLP